MIYCIPYIVYLFINNLVLCQLSRMDSVEIKVDPKFHKHIIGKQGSNGRYFKVIF